MGDTILKGIVEEKLCGRGRLVKVKCFPGSTVDDLSHHIINNTKEAYQYDYIYWIKRRSWFNVYRNPG